MSQIVIRQTSAFTKCLNLLGNESQVEELAGRLREHPQLGDVIPGTGGLWKIRVALPGKGTRGGGRIIYIWLKETSEIVLLWMYSKGASEDLTSKEKKALAALAAEIKSQSRNAKKEKKG